MQAVFSLLERSNGRIRSGGVAAVRNFLLRGGKVEAKRMQAGFSLLERQDGRSRAHGGDTARNFLDKGSQEEEKTY
ncbi:hypothetical protein [Paenibacillus nasutitermitis]|uniref:Uncharacterized protein n=1 Tax=Paenibacillus nasutitermitis TaxID=1652958 RepID=A0A916Z8Q5_9BACL|nr:hypothetical protein [Paenibacillus nasutitermitis]GGD82062.1 hypothetical protein GCM10010911_45220 [Paenibacillus nasutitermitis]